MAIKIRNVDPIDEKKQSFLSKEKVFLDNYF